MAPHFKRLGSYLGIALIACLFHVGNADAQTAATIVGDITDFSRAVAPNVAVTVINEGAKIECKAQTNEAGQYRVTSN